MFKLLHLFTAILFFYHQSIISIHSTNEMGSPTKSNPLLCKTRDCKHYAFLMRKALYKNVIPCDNFYDHACGSYIKNQTALERCGKWATMFMKNETISKKIREILEEKIKPDNSKALKMAKHWYHSCTNIEFRNKYYLQNLKTLILMSGTWPIANIEWARERKKWQEVHDAYAAMGIDAIYRFRVDVSIIDSKKTALFLQTNLVAPPTCSDKSCSLKYQKLINKVVNLFTDGNNNVPQYKVDEDIKNLIIFERSLVDIAEIEEDEIYTPLEMKVNKFQEWYNNLKYHTPVSKIDWLNSLNRLFESTKKKIKNSHSIEVTSREAIEKLVKLLSATSDRTIVNYIQWHVIKFLLPFTSPYLENVFATYDDDEEIMEEQWSTCVNHLKLTHAIGAEFVKRYLSKANIELGIQLTDIIQEATIQRVDKFRWMNSDLKKRIKAKIKNVEKLVGYPKWYEDRNAVDGYYENLKISNKNYFSNMINYLKFAREKDLMLYDVPWDRSRWTSENTVYSFNPAYIFPSNVLFVPAAVFMEPHFSLNLPAYINYGVTGFLLAHEFSHSVDTNGITYDENGNMLENFPKGLHDSYHMRTLCFVQQYSKYYYQNPAKRIANNLYVDGKATLDENIADTLGLQIAFDAYMNYKKSHVSTKQLMPQLEDYNDEQLFFLSIANFMCEPDFDESELKNSIHSPGRFRVNGAFSNFVEFANTFNCALNTPMNPPFKCNL